MSSIGSKGEIVQLGDVIRTNGSIANVVDDSNAYFSLLVNDGSIRIAGATVSTSLSTDVGSFTLANPSNSPTSIVLTTLKIWASNTLTINFKLDATSTGTSAAPFNPLIGSTNTTYGVASSGVNVLTGGTALSFAAQVALNASYQTNTFIVIPPGHSISGLFTGLAATMIVLAYWID